MGWDNPPVPWQEFERRLSWRENSARDDCRGGDTPPVPWQEFERRLSWRENSARDDGSGGDGLTGGDGLAGGDGHAGGAEARRLRPVTRLPDRRGRRGEGGPRGGGEPP